MKDSTLTIRLPSATRRKVEQFARSESRSLSQATERLIEMGLAAAARGAGEVREPGAPWEAEPPAGAPIAGSLAGGLVPTLDDFRDARRQLSDALAQRTGRRNASSRR